MYPGILVLGLLSSATSAMEPPPLTDEQRTRIGTLANETRKEADRLAKSLEQAQAELARVYSRYTLDEKRVQELENEILSVQRQLLDNHRRMNIELRRLVGEERFVNLQKRLQNMLNSAPQTKENRP